MNLERQKRWVRASVQASRFESFMMPVIQGLGRLDSELSLEDEEFMALPDEQKATIERSFDLTRRATISYLWVLGAYEIVRAIAERMKESPALATPEATACLLEFKERIARLRMPLAKFQAKRTHAASDSPIAYPVLHVEYGTGWQIAQDTFFTRRELGDDLLSVLEGLDAG